MPCLPREIYPATFFELGIDGSELFVGEDARATLEKTGKPFGIENGDWALAFGFDPPPWKNEGRTYRNGSAVEGGKFSCEPSSVVLSLFEAVAVGLHWGRE